MTDPLRLCFTINNCPELFQLSMTLAMNTMTGGIPPLQFYNLGFIKQIFAVDHMKNNGSHRLQIQTIWQKSEQGV